MCAARTEADLLSLGRLPEAQVEVLPEEFHWHVDETPLEAASGYTVLWGLFPPGLGK